jgi:lysophospholipid acyltransferase (LPLAT)-like uncharacterized protein
MMARLLGPHTPGWLKHVLLWVMRYPIPGWFWSASATWRVVTREIPAETEALLTGNTPVIFSLWHGRMFSLLVEPNVRDIGVLISPSNDGVLISEAFKGLGGKRLIRGAHNRGGAQGAREMCRVLQEERLSVAVLADGPRGPGYQVKPGILRVAALSRAPIVPVVASAKHLLWQFDHAWDQFQAPQYTTPLRLVYGAPLHVPDVLENGDLAQWQGQLQHRMMQCTQLADAWHP